MRLNIGVNDVAAPLGRMGAESWLPDGVGGGAVDAVTREADLGTDVWIRGATNRGMPAVTAGGDIGFLESLGATGADRASTLLVMGPAGKVGGTMPALAGTVFATRRSSLAALAPPFADSAPASAFAGEPTRLPVSVPASDLDARRTATSTTNDSILRAMTVPLPGP